MHTETVRINVTLPRDLIETLNEIAGSRARSRLISESLQAYIREMRKVELGKKLEDGYRASAKESTDLDCEFDTADLAKHPDGISF
jgi:metal-responsive CopG/Arc/MetJ family transcriptional regulator